MDCSKWENGSSVTEFVLVGMLQFQDNHLISIGVLSIMYMLSLIGNASIFAATNLDPRLHSPMYFFLGNLSFVDLSITSAILTVCIAKLLLRNYVFLFYGCLLQTFLFLWLVTTECALLAAMSYDRYIAICQPLHYTSIMSRKFCFLLVAACWAVPTFRATLHVSMTYRLCFCGPNGVQSFFCDITPVQELSCSDRFTAHVLVLSEGGIVFCSLSFFMIATYAIIIISILKLRSNNSRKKAFLTCSSHLTIICLFFGTGVGVYCFSSTGTSKGNSIVASLMYTVMPPTLNPFLYSLRNSEIQSALKKGLKWKPRQGS